MEAILLIGIQGAGKSTFCACRLAGTHARINLDTLKTRKKEQLALEACVAGGESWVVDNTNLLVADRARYIPLARANGYRVKGFLFDCPLEDAQRRNDCRSGRACVPSHVITAAARRLEPPAWSEGFDELYTVTPADGDFILERWPDPAWPKAGSEQKPWTRWWWHGSAVDEKNLTRELETLQSAGFGGVEITPIYGVRGFESRHIPFLSERWLEVMAHACREAKRLGLGVDIVPGTGWRLGGPAVPADEQAVMLVLKKTVARGRARYEAIAAPSGEKVKRPAPGGEGFTIDMLDRGAVRRFLERFNNAFFRAIPPGLVRAQFHDSWEYGTDWSRNLLAVFKARRGYDLRRHLEALDDAAGTPGETAARVRYDYRITVEEMLLDHFSRNWNGLCKKRGLLTRNQAHGSVGNLLDIYAVADIPETEIFRDAVDPLINKFASSAGHTAGRRLISAESFTWLSEHFQSDLGKMKRFADHLFISGVNHLFYHGTAYSPADAAWPGWLFYASTQVNSRNPLWPHWPALNTYIARCQSFLQAGEPDNDVLVYWPLHDLQMTGDGRLRKFSIDGDHWTFGDSLNRTARPLWNGGFHFDYVSDRQLATASFGKGGIRLKGGRYRALVLPELRYLPLETARLLLEAVRQGVPVISRENPENWDVPGHRNLAARRKALKSIAAKLASQPSFTVSSEPGSALLSTGIRPDAWMGSTGLRALRRRLPGGDSLLFIANQGAGTDTLIAPAVSRKHARFLDPWTGRTGKAETTPGGLRLQLDAGESVLLCLSDRPPTDEGWRYRPTATAARAIEGPWQISFPQGGPVCPAPLERAGLDSITRFGDPELERFAGTVRYETRFDVDPLLGTDASLELGSVKESARVFLNGLLLGLQALPPFRFGIPAGVLKKTDNRLVVEVVTLAANRIRDLDRRKVDWKIFLDINIVDLRYKPFDASGWELRDAGLLGPVRLVW
jgi:predicted kinase